MATKDSKVRSVYQDSGNDSCLYTTNFSVSCFAALHTAAANSHAPFTAPGLYMDPLQKKVAKKLKEEGVKLWDAAYTFVKSPTITPTI